MRSLIFAACCGAAVPALTGALPASAAIDPAARCINTKAVATAKHARRQLVCHARAARKNVPVDPTCLAGADARLVKFFDRAEIRGGCPTAGDADILMRLSQALSGRAVAELHPTTSPSLCDSKKLLAGGKAALKAARAHGRNLKKPDLGSLAGSFQKLSAVLDNDVAQAELKGDCQSTGGVAEVAGLIDAGLDSILAALHVVGHETLHVASSAEPAETPGTAGVDANDYPKLVVQYGNSGFSLNRATYTRFFYGSGADQPDAILILVPGFEGGGASFQILAENLVSRAAENESVIEVWAFDRRGNQLEDREGVALAVAARDPQIALDWFFGSELGQPLHPALAAGPNRRAEFHNTSTDTAFMANWTSLVFSRDIDAVVETARATAKNQNVFLGGHSAGTGFTARYAATDFDLTGGGPVEAGYTKLRGLVLLEGGGGSVGSPLGEDALDRVEDKFDGGLFHAVRDAAPRCTDGTPCTVATEAADCAGLGNETCTEPTAAYAVVPGLLNPRIFAASEPGSVQSIDDPDTGQVIVQVDQGAPGNNVIAVVPDLGILSILPQATAEGALGSFIDDDGLISSFASFVRTSVGGPGAVNAGLRSWNGIADAPQDPAVIPDNGPAPTSLPASEWGQEKEITRLDRVGETFRTAGSNFADWYYPTGGQSITSGIGLDSTQLSVGRSRRDIENLTQAANIDIPVIAFGGTNGLTAVPASFLSFASTIAACAAASCDGTPRVIDPSNPNPAFPTYGDVPGGFEVHLSEGYAHVDIVTAEDDAHNNVTAPLLDFLVRNAQ